MLHLDDAKRTLNQVSKYLKKCSINHIKIDGILVLDRPKKLRIEQLFVHVLITALPNLRWLGLSLTGKRYQQITSIGNSLRLIKGNVIDIRQLLLIYIYIGMKSKTVITLINFHRLSDSCIDSARHLAQSIGHANKFEVRVSTFGTSSGILVQVIRINTKN